MKYSKNIFTIAVFSVLLLASTPGAFAASFFDYDLTAEATSAIDWDSFSIHYTGTGTAQNSFNKVNATMIDNDLNATNDSGTTEAMLGTSSGWAEAIVDPVPLQGFIPSLYATTGTWDTIGYEGAFADISYSGEFYAATSGTLTISFNYYLLLYTEADLNEWAYAMASVLLNIGDQTTLDAENFESLDKSFHAFDTYRFLTLSVDMIAGQTIDFSASAIAAAEARSPVPDNPVPVPAAIWLLCGGLIGLAGLKRKFIF